MKKLNRQMRRLEKAHHRKEANLGKWDDPLDEDTEGYRNKVIENKKSSKHLEFFGSNKLLSIVVFTFDDMYIMGFRRNTSDKDIPWHVKYYWKEDFGFNTLMGYECFPPKDKLIDQANMYWMMIPRDSAAAKIDLNDYSILPKLLGGGDG